MLRKLEKQDGHYSLTFLCLLNVFCTYFGLCETVEPYSWSYIVFNILSACLGSIFGLKWWTRGDVAKASRKCVPLHESLWEKINCEFFKGSWKITAIVK